MAVWTAECVANLDRAMKNECSKSFGNVRTAELATIVDRWILIQRLASMLRTFARVHASQRFADKADLVRVTLDKKRDKYFRKSKTD